MTSLALEVSATAIREQLRNSTQRPHAGGPARQARSHVPHRRMGLYCSTSSVPTVTYGNSKTSTRDRRRSRRRQGAGHQGVQYHPPDLSLRPRGRRERHVEPADQGAGQQRARESQGSGRRHHLHRRRGSRRMGARRLRRCRRAHPATRAAPVLQPRRGLGRQAGARQAADPEHVRRRARQRAAERRRRRRGRRRSRRKRRPRKTTRR